MPAKPAERGTAPRRVAESKPAAGSKAPFDLVTVVSIAAGVLVALFLVIFFVRRRSLPTDIDVTTLAADAEPSAEAAPQEEALGSDGFSVGQALSEMPVTQAPVRPEPSPEPEVPAETLTPRSAPEPPTDHPGGEAERTPLAVPATPEPIEKEEEPEGLGLFDDEGETSMMNQDATDLPADRVDAHAATMPTISNALGGNDEMSAVVKALESRMAQLEARIEEQVEARERLERQVAAQSEELRVQRAAIARTQRALRSLNRSEDDHATEPAPKNPA